VPSGFAPFFHCAATWRPGRKIPRVQMFREEPETLLGDVINLSDTLAFFRRFFRPHSVFYTRHGRAVLPALPKIEVER